MTDDDILHLEAMHIIREASDDLLRLAGLEELDFNRVARNELRTRRRDIGHQAVIALSREMQP